MSNNLLDIYVLRNSYNMYIGLGQLHVIMHNLVCFGQSTAKSGQII